MKKILCTLIALLMVGFGSAVMAEENTAVTSAVEQVLAAEKPVQGVDIDASGLVLVFQKQPQADTSVQYVKVRRCGLVAVITLNGKVKEAEAAEAK